MDCVTTFIWHKRNHNNMRGNRKKKRWLSWLFYSFQCISINYLEVVLLFHGFCCDNFLTTFELHNVKINTFALCPDLNTKTLLLSQLRVCCHCFPAISTSMKKKYGKYFYFCQAENQYFSDVYLLKK